MTEAAHLSATNEPMRYGCRIPVHEIVREMKNQQQLAAAQAEIAKLKPAPEPKKETPKP